MALVRAPRTPVEPRAAGLRDGTSRRYARWPVHGNVLEALREGRLEIGSGTLLEPGVWITMPGAARVTIGEGCFLNLGVMVACVERVEIGDHCMFANGCFVSDGSHRFDDPTRPVTWQGFRPRARRGSATTSGVAPTSSSPSGVTIGERCVIGANSVVTKDLPPYSIAAGAPARV